jgi:threonine/homoserine/homoserine lactone efflux protein
VWLALMARGFSGGVAAVWPLVIGLALGDAVWPVAAILGLNAAGRVVGDVLGVLEWAAAAIFVAMGLHLLLRPAADPGHDGRFTRPGVWAGFAVGLVAVIGNPRAILFCMAARPGVLRADAARLSDIAAIAAIPALVPAAGNRGLAVFVDRARRVVASPAARRRLNLISGAMLVAVGLFIPFV